MLKNVAKSSICGFCEYLIERVQYFLGILNLMKTFHLKSETFANLGRQSIDIVLQVI